MKPVFFVAAIFILSNCYADDRASLWVDLYKGEPIAFDDMITDLTSVQMVFIGEAHRVERHHNVQREIVQALFASGKKVLLGIEMLEAEYQETLDKFNRHEINFDELADQTEWAINWKNYADYKQILETVIANQGKIAALNANAGIIRSIGRNGLDSLKEEERNTLPTVMNFDDPLYEKWLNQIMLVHMPFTEDMLWKVYQAQVARDEQMAYQMAKAWKALDNQKDWIGVILCGSGHCSYGNGTVSRLLRHLPDVKDRVVLMSESGDTVLTEQEKEMTRDIEISHEDLRFLNRPIADYLYVTEHKEDNE